MDIHQITNKANTMKGTIESSLALLEDAKRYLPPTTFEDSFGIVISEFVQVGFDAINIPANGVLRWL